MAGKVRHQLAVQHLVNIQALDRKITAIRAQIAGMVQDSGTGLAGLFGIGLVIAGRLAEAGYVRRSSWLPAAAWNAAFAKRWVCGAGISEAVCRAGNVAGA